MRCPCNAYYTLLEMFWRISLYMTDDAITVQSSMRRQVQSTRGKWSNISSNRDKQQRHYSKNVLTVYCSSPPTCGSWEPLGKKTAQQQSASRLPNEISYCNLYTQADKRVYNAEHQQMNDLKGQCNDIFDSLFCCCTYEQAKPFP